MRPVVAIGPLAPSGSLAAGAWRATRAQAPGAEEAPWDRLEWSGPPGVPWEARGAGRAQPPEPEPPSAARLSRSAAATLVILAGSLLPVAAWAAPVEAVPSLAVETPGAPGGQESSAPAQASPLRSPLEGPAQASPAAQASQTAARLRSSPEGPAPAAQAAPSGPAVRRPGTSDVLDDNLTFRVGWPVKSRSFGHYPVDGHLFDRQGNWADSDTAVTGDQLAAMPAEQQRQFARRIGAKQAQLKLGDPERALVDPAVGAMRPGDKLDLERTLQDGPSPGSIRNFGHTAVEGRLFKGRAWADTGSLVSADQVAAMGTEQRQALARSAEVPLEELRVGRAERALVERSPELEGSRFDNFKPRQMVTFMGHRMQARVAARIERLVRLVEKAFPGRPIEVTATVEGKHSSRAHQKGRAVDFVVKPLTKRESKTVEKLAWQAGLRPYNEYIHSSAYKTGPHMHVSVD